MIWRAVFLSLVAAPAWAEPQPAVQALMHYTAGIETCLSVSETPEQAEACIGPSAQACMDTEADGYTTVGMMFCTLAEAEAWDVELNRAYRATMEQMRALDAEETSDHYAIRADRLREAQRAWIALRDADCALEHAIWGAGTMRQIAGASCHLDATATRAIHLKFLGN